MHISFPAILFTAIGLATAFPKYMTVDITFEPDKVYGAGGRYGFGSCVDKGIRHGKIS